VADAAAVEALRDPSARAIVELLSGAPRSVGQIGAVLPIDRVTIDRLLVRLEQVGLVTEDADEGVATYRLHDDGAAAVRRSLEHTWGEAAARFRDLADRDARAEEQT
jgi:DNA-binding transcriptional ArsR family regulator